MFVRKVLNESMAVLPLEFANLRLDLNKDVLLLLLPSITLLRTFLATCQYSKPPIRVSTALTTASMQSGRSERLLSHYLYSP